MIEGKKLWEQLKELEEAGHHVGRHKLQLILLTKEGYYGGGGTLVFDGKAQIEEYVKNVRTLEDGREIVGYRISYTFFADEDVKLPQEKPQ